MSKPKGPETVGRKKLDAWLDIRGNTVTGLATTLGISQPTVSGWRNGLWRPIREYREALERICGIPVDDWETDEETGERLALEKRLRKIEAHEASVDEEEVSTLAEKDPTPTAPGVPHPSKGDTRKAAGV